MKKILVTGAAGMIGFALSHKLESLGYAVIKSDLRFCDNSLDFTSHNIIPLLEQCDGVIHLAGISRVIDGEKHTELCKEINVNGTIKFLNFCKNINNKPWFIYGSSREVYGQQKVLPVSEDVTLKPLNVYAESKVSIENTISDLRKHGFKGLILRFSNVYGGMLDHYNRVIPAFCLNALKNDLITIEGSECVFDFTYINDVVDGIALAVNKMQKNILQEPAIHFTGNRGCNLEHLAKIILKITGSNSNLKYYPARTFDVGKFYGDYSLATKLLNWRPKHSLEDGLKKFIYEIKNSAKECPYNLKMTLYEDIKSYSWLPALL